MSPEKKHIHQQNDLNTKRRQYQTQTSQYINGNGNVKDVKFSVNDNHSTTDSKHSNGNNNGCGERTTSPVPLGTEKIRLTMDVNNSRPSSQSSTPVLTRKAAIRDGSHTSSTQSSSAVAADQNRSNSSSSLKDSQAKDIMISYSHLDKEIMLKLKGMRDKVLVVWLPLVMHGYVWNILGMTTISRPFKKTILMIMIWTELIVSLWESVHVLGASSWNLNYHCSFEAVTALLQAIHTPWQSYMHIKSHHLTASSRMQIIFEFIPFDCSQWNLLLTIYSATLDTHGMSFLLTDMVWYWLKQHDASIYTWPCNLYAAITFCTAFGYQLWSLLQLHRV